MRHWVAPAISRVTLRVTLVTRTSSRTTNPGGAVTEFPGESSIVLSLRQQKAYFYKGGRLVGVSQISSGDPDHSTPRGRFTIQQKDQWHQSSQYGDYVDSRGNPIEQNIDRNVDPMPRGGRFDGANMYYYMRFTRGIGMHAGYLPGYAASHGCVRMPQDMAQAFYRNVHVGTSVEVR